MYALALRHVRAVEGILIPMMEPVLNPLWVFLLLGETPGSMALPVSYTHLDVYKRQVRGALVVGTHLSE